MIRLFSKLCKHFKQISFENELAIFHGHMKAIDLEALVCPFCSAKKSLSKFSSYKRHLVTYENNNVQNNVITISRYICSSCKHTHAILPAVIIPYLSFSFKFTISIIYDYLLKKFKSVEALCEHYHIAISTFYRIFNKFKEHKKLWLGLLEDKLTSNKVFAHTLKNASFADVEHFVINFLNKTNISFFQETS